MKHRVIKETWQMTSVPHNINKLISQQYQIVTATVIDDYKVLRLESLSDEEIMDLDTPKI